MASQILMQDEKTDENKNIGDDFHSYLMWAKENVEAIYHYPLKIEATSDGERGVLCDRKIDPDTIVFSIPYEGLLKFQSVSGTPLETLLSAISPLREEDILALLLLFEKNKGTESQWSGHIEILPESYDSVLYFTEEELEALQGSNLHTVAQKLKTQVTSDYEEFSTKTLSDGETLAQKFPWFTLEAYKWALCTIWSRFVSIVRQGQQMKVMAPVFDMFNHDPTAAVMHGFQDMNDCLHIVTFQEWAPNKEIFINYGPLPNRALLQLYGFVILNNPFDSVELWASMDVNCPDYQIKKQVLEGNGIKDKEDPFLLGRGGFDNKLLATLRVQRAAAAELATIHHAFENEPLSMRNESEVLDELEEAIKKLQIAYPTTVEEDEELIKTWSETEDLCMTKDHQKMAVITRVGEKQVLHAALLEIEARRRCFGRSVVLISHAGMQRKLVGTIISRIEGRGFKLCGMKVISSEQIPNSHPFKKEHTSGATEPIIATLWDGKDCISEISDIVGDQDPTQCHPGSINSDFCLDPKQQVCYASRNAEVALVDAVQWFLGEDSSDVIEWENHSKDWVEEIM